FFSSRRRHTRFSRDWSSDVCSSDLDAGGFQRPAGGNAQGFLDLPFDLLALGDSALEALFEPGQFDAHGIERVAGGLVCAIGIARSEERRVGKECRSRWAEYESESIA